MIGRENQKENDLFFTCSLIDYIARKTKNKRVDVVNQLGKKLIEKIYNLAEEENLLVVEALFKAYNSFVSGKIDDYNSSFYYDVPQNILNAYIYNEIE